MAVPGHPAWHDHDGGTGGQSRAQYRQSVTAGLDRLESLRAEAEDLAAADTVSGAYLRLLAGALGSAVTASAALVSVLDSVEGVHRPTSSPVSTVEAGE